MKLKSITSPACGEVLSSQELMSIVGGCSVTHNCYCYPKGGGIGDRTQLFPSTHSKEACDSACKSELGESYSHCIYYTGIRPCTSPFCDMYGSGSNSGSGSGSN